MNELAERIDEVLRTLPGDSALIRLGEATGEPDARRRVERARRALGAFDRHLAHHPFVAGTLSRSWAPADTPDATTVIDRLETATTRIESILDGSVYLPLLLPQLLLARGELERLTSGNNEK